ncbi:MAG: hypothetical protein NTW00_00695 [Hyphomicrobiales bacterium]|nr:hypothetical protein [Hyphomicrobiales bacterium]
MGRQSGECRTKYQSFPRLPVQAKNRRNGSMNVFFDAAKLRQHRQEQAAHGFPLLRACPNTSAIARITFLDTLAPAEREDFAKQLSCLEDEQASRPPPTHADFQEMVRAFPLLARLFGASIGLHPPQATALDIRQVPVKVMAKLLAEAGAGGLEALGKTLMLSDEPEARRPSPAHAASLDEAVPVAPARLRKLIDRMMSDRFGATGQAIDKQHTVYDALVPAGQLRLHATFSPPGRMTKQLQYHIEIRGTGHGLAAYETVWRTPGVWDYLTESNADRSIVHLGTLIGVCLTLL